MRRFEFAEGSSSKFWEIEQVEAELNIRWGRIGTQGQSQTKGFADAAKAKAAMDKLVSEKTGKGYVEAAVASGATIGATVAKAKEPGTAPAAPAITAATVTKVAPEVIAVATVAPASVPEPHSEAPTAAATSDFTRIELPQTLRLLALPSRRFPGEPRPAPTLSAALASLRPALLKHVGIRAEASAAAELLEAGWAWLQQKQPEAGLETEAAALAILAASGAQFDGTDTLVPPVVSALIAERGLIAALDRLLYAELELGTVDEWHQQKRRIRFHSPVDRRLGMRWGSPVSAVEASFRRALAQAPEALYQQAVTRIRAVLPQLHDERQVVLCMLLPDEPELSNALARRLAGPNAPEVLHWLQLTATATDALELIRKLKLDAYTARFLDQADLVATLVQERGLEALPLLLAQAEGEQAGTALGAYGVPSAIEALARAAATNKAALTRFTTAVERWPQAAFVALAKLAAGGSKEASLANGSLGTLLVRDPGLATVLHEHLSPAAQALVERLLQQLSGPKEVASSEQLPPVLARPPWLQPARKAQAALALEPLPLAPVELWEPGVREAALKTDKWLKDRIRQMEANPQQLAFQLGFDHRVDKQQKILLEAGLKSIREADAAAFIECWRQRKQFVKSQPWSYLRLGADELLLLPGDMGTTVWNELSGEADYESSPLRMVATHGLKVLPGLLKCVRRNPGENLVHALHFGAVELSAQMARACAKLKTQRATARKWLLKFPEHAACGLIAPALGKAGEARDCAGVALRWLAENGQLELLQQVAARYPQPAVKAALAAVLAESPLDRFPSRRPPLPGFWQARAWRRPVLAGGPGAGKALPDAALDAIGTMLAFPTSEGLYPGIEQVREACTADSLAAFAWDCFSAWMVAGSPSKDGWALTALGWFGTDDTARRLTPYLRAWPGEAAHARAVIGLDVLATIGSDVALMLLNGIAQKLKFKGLQDRAREKINEIASARGLSTEELEDRLAPDLGLDEHGSLVLDFGPRSFKVSFDEALRPYVRDADGARLPDLPKPKKTDDASLAAAATERFKLLKKDARTIAAQQVLRLEVAMCLRRRWTVPVFRSFLVEHPLLRHLVQRLVWGTYRMADEGASHGGQLLTCFRVAEDLSFSTASDDACELPTDPAVRIGVVHALELSADQASAFAQLFADYELLQPFAQLGRDTWQLTPAELGKTSLERWRSVKVPTGRVLGLANKGWRRGEAADGGWIGYFSKPLGGGRVIELSLEPGIIVGMVDEEPEQSLLEVRVGKMSSWGEIQEPETLDSLDPIIASELIREMEALRG